MSDLKCWPFIFKWYKPSKQTPIPLPTSQLTCCHSCISNAVSDADLLFIYIDMEEVVPNKAVATFWVPGFLLLSAMMATALKYLECESTNTKFCYYIYSLHNLTISVRHENATRPKETLWGMFLLVKVTEKTRESRDNLLVLVRVNLHPRLLMRKSQ